MSYNITIPVCNKVSHFNKNIYDIQTYTFKSSLTSYEQLILLCSLYEINYVVKVITVNKNWFWNPQSMRMLEEIIINSENVV